MTTHPHLDAIARPTPAGTPGNADAYPHHMDYDTARVIAWMPHIATANALAAAEAVLLDEWAEVAGMAALLVESEDPRLSGSEHATELLAEAGERRDDYETVYYTRTGCGREAWPAEEELSPTGYQIFARLYTREERDVATSAAFDRAVLAGRRRLAAEL